jgi:hypothetical protein
MRRHIGRAAVAAVLVVTAGCGDAVEDVRGKVTYNGEPLAQPGGKIVFVGRNGRQVAAEIGPDGAYRAGKVQAGPNRVAVYYPNPQAHSGKPVPKRGAAGAEAAPTQTAVFLTPAKYASVGTSDLSVQVGKGTVFDANLSGPPIP